MFPKKALLFTSVVVLALQGLPVVAQELDEVIVTARKREESILKVPVVETAISQQTLEQYQILDLTDLSSKVPGLSLGNAVLSIGPQISIRGIGTSTLDAGVDQSVSLNIDGLSMTQGLAYSAGLFDLAQAEVLKGPQALFFGKNSPGGVVSLHTADPGDKPEIIARYGYESEAIQNHAELILSTPVTSTFGVRLASSFNGAGGFFYNKALAAPGTGAEDPAPNRISATQSDIVRGTAVWKPVDAFDARLKLNWTKDDTQGDAGLGQLTSCPNGKTAPDGIPFINPNDDCSLDRNIYVVSMDPAAWPGIRNGGHPFLDLTQKFGSLELNYRPSTDVTLTSVTGYYHADAQGLINGTLAGFAAPAIAADNDFSRRDITQELRADTEFTGPLNFTGGAFYQDGQVFQRVLVLGNTAYLFPATLVAGTHQIDIKSYSLFGQARWKPVSVLELAGGVRWTDEKRGDTPYNLITGKPVYVAPVKPEIKSNNYSPEFTATYTPTDEVTLFGSLKQGYKSGSYTITTPVTPGVDNSFGDEKIDGGEIGLKSRLLDRTLSFNIATYYYIYKGLQVGTNEPAQDGIPVIKTLNAGAAKIYGIDFDAAYRPPVVERLTLSTAINWNRARFTDLKNVPCWGGQTIAEGCNAVPNLSGAPGSIDPLTGKPLFTAQGNLDGLPLTRAPDWQATAGGTYQMPVGDALKMSFGLDAQYTSHYVTALNNRADSVQPGYTLLNSNVSLGSSNDFWQVAFIANNITNKITTGACTLVAYSVGQVLPGSVTGGPTTGPAGTAENTCVARPGRELWVRVTLRPLAWSE
jgi:iron complex outermembrane recepter protein